MANASELLEAVVGTFNDGDWVAADELWADNGTQDEIGTGRTFNARESTQNAQAWKAAFPDAHGVIENQIASGSQAVGELVWTGTHKGPLAGPMGSLPATGKQIRVRAVMVASEENGRLRRLHHYIDVAGMMAQLGVGAAR